MNFKLSLLFISLVVFASSCKKDKNKDKGEGSENFTAELVYEVPKMEQSEFFMSSMNGKYFISITSKSSYASGKAFFSTDNGNSWNEIASANMPFEKRDIYKNCLTNGGYMAIQYKLLNLNTKGLIDINFPEALYPTMGDEVLLGADDYVYVKKGDSNGGKNGRYFCCKINDNNWDSLTLIEEDLGYYSGQDAVNGGITFCNLDTKKFYIHNPKNNTFEEYNINIDKNFIWAKYQTNEKPKFHFNGKDVVLAAHLGGYAFENIKTNESENGEWPEGTLASEIEVTIDGNNNIYAYTKGVIEGYYKIKNNNITSIYSRSNIVARGDNVYFLNPFNFTKINKGTQTEFYTTSINYVKYITNTQMDYITYNGDKIYALIGSDEYPNKLFTYSNSTKKFELVERVQGYAETYYNNAINRFNYVYAEGSRTYVYGQDSTLYSLDNGNTWTAVSNNAQVKDMYQQDRGNINFITKQGGTYLGLVLYGFNYNLGGTGFSTPKFSYGVFSSSDLINWTEISHAYNIEGNMNRGISPSGMMSYNVNKNPMGNPVYEYQVSYDKGQTWKESKSNVYVGEVYDEKGNTFFMLPTGSKYGIKYYKGNGIDLISETYVNQHNFSSTVNMTFDKNKNLYVNTGKQLIRIK